jgi:hypothetical protein
MKMRCMPLRRLSGNCLTVLFIRNSKDFSAMNHSEPPSASVLYPFVEEWHSKFIHPDDLSSFIALRPTSKVFEIQWISDSWAKLTYGLQQFRVSPELARPIPSTQFSIGQLVGIRSNNLPAKVVEIMWHFKECRPMYFVVVFGKRKSRRYWDDELMECSSPGEFAT